MKFIAGDSKKVKIIIAVGLIGIVLIFMSDIFNDSDKSENNIKENTYSYDEYTENLENKLKNVIADIDGVGECEIMITLQNTNENVYATDVEIQDNGSSASQKDEYVLYDSDSGESPVLIKEYLPQVQGVTVVCTGGDIVTVREKIINCVTSLFNIPTNRVSVSKIKT